MNEKLSERARWGVYQDPHFFMMWVVQPVEDPSDERKFWFFENADAEKFISLLNKSVHKARR